MRVLLGMVVALALAGCGSDGGDSEQESVEAPLCDPPEDLACPDGMRAEPAADGDREGVWCWEGQVRHPLYMRIRGDMLWYSPPPFDTRTECWPAGSDGAIAWRYSTGLNTEAASADCFDQGGAPVDCADIIDQANTAWGL